MDNLTYTYTSACPPSRRGTNKLAYVDDAVSSGNYTTDIDDQSSGNYDYDAIGNLTKDVGAGITNIDWYVNGKIKQVTKTGGITIDFEYDATGNRAVKKVTTILGGATTVNTTYYTRDAQGNVMGIYTETLTGSTQTLKWTESPIYGSSRLGSYKPDKVINTSSNGQATVIRGYRNYELSNHLGNVCVVINDKKTPTCVAGNPVSWTAEIIEANDYYPFGMVMPVRTYILGSKKYRYGMNTQEKDDDIILGAYTAEFWEYDSRISRRWNRDPVVKHHESPYAVLCDNPQLYIDPLGDSESPIYDNNGDFLGTDDQGLKGDAIVMGKSEFKQGMSHTDAISKGKLLNQLPIVTNPNFIDKINKHFENLKIRPDYDGFVTIDEGIDWAKNHPNTLPNNISPDNSLYIDASKLNFGSLNVNNIGLKKGDKDNVNLLDYVDMTSSSSIATTYALGNTQIQLLNSKTGKIKLFWDDYDWDIHDWPLNRKLQGLPPDNMRDNLVLAERRRAGLDDSHGFRVYIFGTATIPTK